MRLVHPGHPGRAVRLAYCLNLHPARDLAGLLEGLTSITLPLARRFQSDGLAQGFGVGLWLPAELATTLASDAGARELAELGDFLAAHGLDPFTFNAFPYEAAFQSGFQKERVFQPTWREPARLEYTLAVARVALALRRSVRGPRSGGAHVSISTHAGMLRPPLPDGTHLAACAEGFSRAARGLAELAAASGVRVVLALEPEPRSLANDTSELAPLFALIGERAGREHLRAHVGTCLDTCHAAVEFEDPCAAFANATAQGVALGKLQFSSALALRGPSERPEARALFLGMDEPRFLHQVTGRGPGGRLHALDLPELAAAYARDPRWAACDEWRCHFHVPVDLERVGDGERGLGTTRAEADRTLAAALAEHARWGAEELHVEIETYTWSVLRGATRGPGAALGSRELADGLEREYRHVLAELARAGWTPERAG